MKPGDALKLRGIPIMGAPADGQVLAYNAATKRLEWTDPPTGGAELPLGAFAMVWRGELDGDRQAAEHGTVDGYNAGDVVHYGTPSTEGLYICTGPNLLEGGSLFVTMIEVPIVEEPATRAPDCVFHFKKSDGVSNNIITAISGTPPTVADSDSTFTKLLFDRQVVGAHLTRVSASGVMLSDRMDITQLEISAELPAHVMFVQFWDETGNEEGTFSVWMAPA